MVFLRKELKNKLRTKVNTWQRCAIKNLEEKQTKQRAARARDDGLSRVAIVAVGYFLIGSIIYPAVSWSRRAIRPTRLTIGLLQNPLMGTIIIFVSYE